MVGYMIGYSAPVLAEFRERRATTQAGFLLPHLRPGMARKPG